MENKKTKLTISGSTKKSFENFKETNFKDKKTVIIDKKKNYQSSNKSFGLKKTSSFNKKDSFSTNKKLIREISNKMKLCLLNSKNNKNRLEN